MKIRLQKSFIIAGQPLPKSTKIRFYCYSLPVPRKKCYKCIVTVRPYHCTNMKIPLQEAFIPVGQLLAKRTKILFYYYSLTALREKCYSCIVIVRSFFAHEHENSIKDIFYYSWITLSTKI